MKSKTIIALLFIVGGISFLLGLYCCYSMYEKSCHLEHTRGIVKEMRVHKVYKHRKMRRIQEAVINYDTNKYGNYQISMRLSNPLIFQGTELTIWYNPERPEHVVIPYEDGLTWIMLLGFGLLCLVLGAIGVKGKKEEDFEEIRY